ncbi:MAG: M48 family metallopeptidase [Dokdonella sp.]
MRTFAGRYFDGRSGIAHTVELCALGSDALTIRGDGIERTESLSTLSITPRLARIDRSIAFADGARVQIADDASLDALFPQSNRLERFVDRLERRAYAVAAAVVICVVTLFAGFQWGVPWLADRIVEQIPAKVDHALGARVLTTLDQFGLSDSTLSAARQNELRERFSVLARELPATRNARVQFRDAPSVGANAFALPGGTVVVTDQLVEMLDDDREFDAVVAHELGHEHGRHALRQTLRSSFVLIVAAFFTGDVSSASAVVVGVPTFLLRSHYSRGFEAEADAYGFALLSRHDESPHWFARTMTKLQAANPDSAELPYLSSHPATAQRIVAANIAGAEFALSHPALCPDKVCPGDVIEPAAGEESTEVESKESE